MGASTKGLGKKGMVKGGGTNFGLFGYGPNKPTTGGGGGFLGLFAPSAGGLKGGKKDFEDLLDKTKGKGGGKKPTGMGGTKVNLFGLGPMTIGKGEGGRKFGGPEDGRPVDSPRPPKGPSKEDRMRRRQERLERIKRRRKERRMKDKKRMMDRKGGRRR
jgi:hypothetical protein